MFIDLSPFKANRDFRYVYAGQFISFFGTMITYVAVPYQVYQLSNSTLMVGLLGITELLPLLIAAFIGGTLADVMDKKKLLIFCEIGMALGCFVLLGNSFLDHPYWWLIFIVAAFMSALSGLHRPSLDALMPRTVSHHEIQAASVLLSLKGSVGLIGGPAVAGLCIAYFGLPWTYVLDFCTFIISIAALSQISSYKVANAKEQISLKNMREAVHYALSRQELLGTYVIDFVAMVLAMPNALFPALAQLHGSTKILGWFYAAPAIGSLIVVIFSGWAKKVERHGASVAISALIWGLAMVAMGLSHHVYLILIFLILAGAADCVSGIFRTTIWNETIPDKIRGRMASLEVISYSSGPLLGNAQAGIMASMLGTETAITVGGSLCAVGVVAFIFILPKFWRYNARR